MAYTVKKLAKLSGVSIRTLHYYDEIGLLKPAYYGENQYRYYEEAELLILQQILFFRQLGFPLADIQGIIQNRDFDKLSALESHREALKKSLKQTKQLLETIDKTIAHLRGTETMKIEEVFEGFNSEKQKLYEDFLVESGVQKDIIDKSKEKVKNWTKDQWLVHKAKADKVHEELAKVIDKNLEPSSAEVQKIIETHYQLTTVFWTPTKEGYIGLADFYASHPDFVKFYEEIHPELLEFLMEAMKIYAKRKLK